mgnify:FL=1
MGMIKIIASDLDGTLLYNGQLSKNNYMAVKQLQDNGIEFVMASGRNITEIKLVDFRDIVCPKVLINGGVVVDEDYSVISATYMSYEEMATILDYINKYKVGAIFYGAEKRFGVNVEIMADSFKADGDVFGSNFFNDLKEIKSLDEIDVDICKVEVMDGVRFDMLKEMGDKILTTKKFGVTSSYPNNIEITPLNVDKFRGLKSILEKNDYKDDEVAIFGDSDNDFELFENVTESYAMGNANDRIKSHAKYVIGSCKDDGFYLEVMKILHSK